MLELLPDETEVLVFSGNNINFLFSNLLGMTQDHELLKVIDMSNNNITEISGQAFHKVSNVEILILNHNNLKITGTP
jgi:Leucine-rich repeat (LRR) protein